MTLLKEVVLRAFLDGSFLWSVFCWVSVFVFFFLTKIFRGGSAFS